MRAYGFTIEDATAIIALGGGNASPAGAFAALGIVQVLLGIAIYVWTALALTAVFRKVGIEPWRAWVPVLNMWELFVLAGMRGWWAAVLAGGAVLVTIVAAVVGGLFAGVALNAGFGGDAGSAAGALAAAAIVPSLLWLGFLAFALVIHIRMLRALCRGFGLGTGHVVLGALLFPVWASIVGWGSARWLGRDAAVDPAPFRAGGAAAGSTAAATPAPGADAAPTIASPAAMPAPALFAPSTPAADASPAPAAPAAPAASEPISASPWAPPPPPAASEDLDPAPQSWSAPTAAPAAPAVPVPVPAPSPSPAPSPTPGATPGATPDPNPPSPQADESDLDEHTVLAARRAPQATLLLPNGSSVLLSSSAAVLGRNPLAPDDIPDAQVVPVDDVTRTISKTHALLQHTATGWTITDLASTNGVFVGPDEVEATGPTPVSGVFHLGDAELHLSEAG